MRSELPRPHKDLLELVYAHFDKHLAWPQRRSLQRQLAQSRRYDLEVEQVAKELKPNYVRLEETVGGEIKLTLRGFHAIYRMVEPTDFMTFLRLALERFHARDVDLPRVSAADLAQRGIDDKRLRKLTLILEGEFFIAVPSEYYPDGRPSVWRVDDAIWKYYDAYSIERYLELRAEHVEGLRRDEVPPLQLLAAEGVAAAGNDAGQAEVQGEGDVLRLPIADRDLALRCADLLRGTGPYDRVVREAGVVLEDRVRRAIGAGAGVRGTALMQHAFGPRDMRLRLSSDPEVQRGAMELYRGVMAFFRNPAGHSLQAEFRRDDAARFVAVIDLLLGLIGRRSGDEPATESAAGAAGSATSDASAVPELDRSLSN